MTAAGTGVTPLVDAPYPMRRWVFVDALDRYDVDLGDSHAECRSVASLGPLPDLPLDYGVDRGTRPLRESVAGLYRGSPERVVITHGAQEALHLLFSTLLGPGDKVVTVQPGWRQSVDLPSLLGCRVEVVQLGSDLVVDVDRVAAAAGTDAQVVAVTSPSNPTGRRTSTEDLRALARLVRRTGGWLVVDEEYRVDLAGSVAAEPDARAVSVSGLSKIHGVPGLRTGWMYGPPDLVSACAERKHLTTVSNSVLTEALAGVVLARRDEHVREYRELCAQGLRVLEDWADRHRGAVRLVPPDGTPFAWLWLDTGESALSYCRRVLDAGVLLMPGETLGGRGGFRVTFARHRDALADGLRRAGEVLARTPPARDRADPTAATPDPIPDHPWNGAR
ncbi:MAG: pyridoxal phosphate-dependent aminotransferase [Mycobacteriales bacterium]